MAKITREQPDRKFLKLYMVLEKREELLALVVALGQMCETDYQNTLKDQGLRDEDPLAVTKAGGKLYDDLKKEINV